MQLVRSFWRTDLLAGISAISLLAGLSTACEEAGNHGLDSTEPVHMVSQALETGVLARITGERNATTIVSAEPWGLLPDGTTTGRFYEHDVNAIVENANPMANSRHAPLGQLVQSQRPIDPEDPDGPKICLLGHGDCLLLNGYGSPTDFTFTEPATGWSNDRLELMLAKDNPKIAFGKTWYLRFYIRLGADFEPPASEFIVHQVWQEGSSGDPKATPPVPAKGPALVIYLMAHPSNPSTKVRLSFRYRNALPPYPQDMASATQFFYADINKGAWTNFHIKATPRYHDATDEEGEILVWQNVGLNGALVESAALNLPTKNPLFDHRFYWGFSPGVAPHNMGTEFHVRVGMYRGIPSKHAPLWFDSIKLTETAAAMTGM